MPRGPVLPSFVEAHSSDRREEVDPVRFDAKLDDPSRTAEIVDGKIETAEAKVVQCLETSFGVLDRRLYEEVEPVQRIQRWGLDNRMPRSKNSPTVFLLGGPMLIRLSTEGQLSIPEEICERHGWRLGSQIEVEDRHDVVILRTAHGVPQATLKDLVGCTGYEGPRRSLEEMDEAVRSSRER